MSLQVAEEVAWFAEQALPFLRQQEAHHNLLLSLLDQLQREPERYPARPTLHAWGQAGTVGAVARRTPPHALLLSEGWQEEAVARLVGYLQQRGEALPGVWGPPRAARAFAAQWAQATGCPFHLDRPQRNYQLEQVQPTGGCSRYAATCSPR